MHVKALVHFFAESHALVHFLAQSVPFVPPSYTAGSALPPPRAFLALMTLQNLWSGHREAQAHPFWLSLAPARWLYRSAALAAPRLA